MTLQTSGAISINNINTELGSASGTTRSLGDTSSRNLAGVPSGAISLSNFYGKSNVQEVIFDNSGGALGNWQNQNLWNTLVSSGIAITSSSVKIILRSITITSSAISIAALETGSGWPAGTNLEVVIESTSQIVGRRGTGGAGAAGTSSGVAASAGGAGGRALTITSAISGGSIKITNQGAIRGGGGGGGGGGRGSQNIGKGSTGYYAGGTGGTGYGSTGTAGVVAAATAGTDISAPGGDGGAGGAAGTVGSAGAAGTGLYSSAGAAGGAAGPAIINSALATIVNTGTISGSLS